MANSREVACVFVGAVVAVLLQIMLAPHIALFAVVPNIMLAYVMVDAIVRCDRWSPVLAFVMGLLFDLLGGGPVGVMAFLMVLVAFVVSHAFFSLNNDTLFMPLFICAMGIVFVELLYGGFLLAMGYQASVLGAFVYRALPCALYDCVAAILLYPLMVRVLASKVQVQPGKARLL